MVKTLLRGLVFGGIGLTVLGYVVVAHSQWKRDGVLRMKNPITSAPFDGLPGTLANLFGREDKRPTHELRQAGSVYSWLVLCAAFGFALLVAAGTSL